MPRILILSSHVAMSRVGGSAQALALARLGLDPILIPTVIFGRHPGLGPPGGAPVGGEVFESMIDAVEAQGLFPQLDAVITGYFATPEQVAEAADALDRISAANPKVLRVVDPIMGDVAEGLYVRDAVADEIALLLVPRADLICPNAWELAKLTGRQVTGAATAVAAAHRLGPPALVSSVPFGGDIAVVYADRGCGWVAGHAPEPVAPKGVGDLLTAFFAAALLQGFATHDALQAAVGSLADLVAACGANDPAIEALPTELAASARVRLEASDA
jgi:pyridoxine kinase